MSWLIKILGLALVLAAPAAAMSNEMPDARDGVQNDRVIVGGVAYPVKLHGVSREWARDCRRAEDSGQACIQLGDALRAGAGTMSVDIIGATGFYELACKKGDGASCARALELFQSSALINHSRDEAVLRVAMQGCDTHQNGDSCAYLVLATYFGSGLPQNKELALGAWDELCGNNVSLACYMKAETVYAEEADGFGTSAQIYESECDRTQAAWACAGFARALWYGQGVKQDRNRSFTISRAACLDFRNRSALACSIYGIRGVDLGGEEALMASRLMWTSCIDGIAEACYQSAVASQRKPAGTAYSDWEYALMFRKGCDLGHAQSCFELAKAYEAGQVNHGDFLSYVALTDKACTLGLQTACTAVRNWGTAAEIAEIRLLIPAINPADPSEVQIDQALQMISGSVEDKRKAVLAVLALSSEGSADATYVTAEWLSTGIPDVLNQSKPDAVIAFENAAAQGHVDAMIEAGFAHFLGEGTATDREKGKEFLLRAANTGSEMAGAIYRSMVNYRTPEELARQRRAEQQRWEAMQAAARRRAAWAARMAPYTSSSSTRTTGYRPASSAGSSLSSDLAAIRSRNDFYAANVSRAQGRSCPTGNSYC